MESYFLIKVQSDIPEIKSIKIYFQERERLQAMMAHLHMTKDAVNNDQDKRDRDGNISSTDNKKSVDPPATGKGDTFILKTCCAYYRHCMISF